MTGALRGGSLTHKPPGSVTYDVVPLAVRGPHDDTVLPVLVVVRLTRDPWRGGPLGSPPGPQGGPVRPGEGVLYEEVLESDPDGVGVGGAEEALDQVVLRLGLYLGQGSALCYAGLQGCQPVGGTFEDVEALGARDGPAGGAGGGGQALEGVGGAAGDGGAGEEREEPAG